MAQNELSYWWDVTGGKNPKGRQNLNPWKAGNPGKVEFEPGEGWEPRESGEPGEGGV